MQELNVNVQNHTNVYQHDGMTEDLAILSRWVKKELFVKVKFLYNPEINLMIGGKIYNMFLLDCKDRLVGLKLLAASDSDCRNRYAQALWSQETKGKRRNLISDGLNTRRSSIYSATQNRFNGKKMALLQQDSLSLSGQNKQIVHTKLLATGNHLSPTTIQLNWQLSPPKQNRPQC